MKPGVLALIVATLVAGKLHAADPVFAKLIGAKTIRCTVGKGAVADFKKNWGAIEIARWGKNNTMHFDSINLKQGTARMIGNAGGTDVVAFATGQGIHFVERTGSGNVHLMTVFGQLVAQTTYKFVISRHISLLGKAIPSQYYGTCEVLD